MPNDRETIALPGGCYFDRIGNEGQAAPCYVLRDAAGLRHGACTWSHQGAEAFAAALTARPAPVAGQPARKTCELAEGGVGLDEIERDVAGEAMVCTGCGTTKTVAWMQARGAMTCCPERKMVSVRDLWWSEHEGRTALARPVSPQDAGVVRDRAEELETSLYTIAEFAHDRSTGPAIEDDLWEVRRMAYDAVTTPPSGQPEKAEASASDQGRDEVAEEVDLIGDLVLAYGEACEDNRDDDWTTKVDTAHDDLFVAIDRLAANLRAALKHSAQAGAVS